MVAVGQFRQPPGHAVFLHHGSRTGMSQANIVSSLQSRDLHVPSRIARRAPHGSRIAVRLKPCPVDHR
jgi:hypothetical protein